MIAAESGGVNRRHPATGHRQEAAGAALRPWSEDQDLLAAINHGDFLIHGCRHRDLQRLLYCTPATSDTECRRRSATIGRKLGLLKAHGLIRKIQHTHRYQVRQRRPDHPRRRPDDGPHYPPADQPVAGGGMTNSSRPQKKLRFSSTDILVSVLLSN